MRNLLILVAVAGIAATAYFTLMEPQGVEAPAPVAVETPSAEPEAPAATPEPEEEETTATDDAVNSVVDQANEAVENATSAAEAAVEAATDALSGEGALADLLTVEGFDFDKVAELINAADIGTLQKTTLIAGLEQAQNNPELLQQILDQIRSAVGL